MIPRSLLRLCIFVGLKYILTELLVRHISHISSLLMSQSYTMWALDGKSVMPRSWQHMRLRSSYDVGAIAVYLTTFPPLEFRKS